MHNILSLPLELLRSIASYLDFGELCAWALSSRVLYKQLFDSETYCQEMLQRFIPNSRDLASARLRRVTYRDIIINTYYRRSALASGQPYHVVEIGRGTDLLLQDGYLCYLNLPCLHVVRLGAGDTARKGLTEVVFRTFSNAIHVELAHLQDGVVSLFVKKGGKRELITYDCRPGVTLGNRCCFNLYISLNKQTIVRHNASSLLLGERSDVDDLDNERRWTFKHYKLDPAQVKFPERIHHTDQFEIGDFDQNTELGNTIQAEIFDNALYIVRNDVTIDPEEPRPINYYYCLRVSLPNLELQLWRCLRRYQTEGPIHDNFTRLMLHHSEGGQHYIKETRKEWLSAYGDKLLRTFYNTSFDPMTNDVADDENSGSDSNNSSEDDNERYQFFDRLRRVKSSLLVRWPSKRCTQPHREFDTLHLRDTIKHHDYKLECSTALDLVSNSGSNDLRICTHHEVRREIPHGSHIDDDDSGAAVVSYDVRLWPPRSGHSDGKYNHDDDSSNALRAAFKVATLGQTFRAASDEGCVIFSACKDETSPVVLVSYDPGLSLRLASSPVRRPTLRNWEYMKVVTEQDLTAITIWSRKIPTELGSDLS